jgi:hypothetical protein
MTIPKFLVGMELTDIVHMHDPGFKAKVIRVGEFRYKLKDIVRWPLGKNFEDIDPAFDKAVQAALVFLSEKAKERKSNPNWLYPV